MIKVIERKDEKKLIIQNATLYINRTNGHLCAVYGFPDSQLGKMVNYIDYHEEDLAKRLKTRRESEWFGLLADGQPRYILFELPTPGFVSLQPNGQSWSNPVFNKQ